ncbi:late competence development ComFB family protein [Thiomicrorhabdus sp.]|uniref:late competence development ComFB family protein n=1 Tax=Thiomicrorhabdus sp. TaxID=2039724 RepID=UPI002AA70145|nr:late competence development ComFB family protein [Thiomicrorhabdus sp.]
MYIPGTLHKESMMPMDSVHNYFERLVFNEIKENYADKFDDSNALADMACIALNRIAPRYIRYDIDMSFYMSVDEHIEVEQKVKKAVKKAYKKVKHFQHEKEQS